MDAFSKAVRVVLDASFPHCRLRGLVALVFLEGAGLSSDIKMQIRIGKHILLFIQL